MPSARLWQTVDVAPLDESNFKEYLLLSKIDAQKSPIRQCTGVVHVTALTHRLSAVGVADSMIVTHGKRRGHGPKCSGPGDAIVFASISAGRLLTRGRS